MISRKQGRREFSMALTVLLGAAASSATAQVPRRYATMSLVGDMLIAVERGGQTGSRLSGNTRTEIKVNGDVVDRAALGTINAAIVNSDPTAKPLSLLVDEPVLYEQQSRLFDGKYVRLPLSLLNTARDGGATHLLLLTKHRAGLSFQFDRGGRAGEGAAGGLGFYIEPDLAMRDLGNDRTTNGFFGLFVHVRATVIDLTSEAIVADRNIVATDNYVNTRAGFGGLPWDALPPREKVRAVAELMLQALRENVPPLLAS